MTTTFGAMMQKTPRKRAKIPLAAIGGHLWPDNWRFLAGRYDGKVRVGVITGHEDPALAAECTVEAARNGSVLECWFQLWPTTGAASMYDWHLGARITREVAENDLWLRNTDGEVIVTDWGRAFPWVDMRSTADRARGGRYRGLRPYEFLPMIVEQWFHEYRGGYARIFFDGYPLRYLAPAWLGANADRLPEGFRPEWQSGMRAALEEMRAAEIPLVIAAGPEMPTITENGWIGGRSIEDFGYREELIEDVWTGERALAAMDATPAGTENALVKVHHSASVGRLAVLAAASAMFDGYLGAQGRTALETLELVEAFQRFRFHPAGKARWKSADREVFHGRRDVWLENGEQRELTIDLPRDVASGW